MVTFMCQRERADVNIKVVYSMDGLLYGPWRKIMLISGRKQRQRRNVKRPVGTRAARV